MSDPGPVEDNSRAFPMPAFSRSRPIGSCQRKKKYFLDSPLSTPYVAVLFRSQRREKCAYQGTDDRDQMEALAVKNGGGRLF